MEIPSIGEFSQDPDKYYAAIGRRFLEIAAKQPTGLRDPKFVDRCFDAMESGNEAQITAILDELDSDQERGAMIRLCQSITQNEPG
jgi:hypothetical protein